MNKKEQFIHVDEDGNKRYFADREMTTLHREDGPAVEWADGSREWYINHKCHREDGPAYECFSGAKEWWFNGRHLTEADFNARMKKELSYN